MFRECVYIILYIYHKVYKKETYLHCLISLYVRLGYKKQNSINNIN